MSFINTGGLFITGAGAINGNVTDATILSIGKDSHGNLGATNFITNGNIGGVPIIHVYKNSAFQANHVIAGVAKKLTVDSGAAVTINNILVGTGSLHNAGVISFDVNSNVRMKEIINFGEINIYGNFIEPDLFSNIGTVNLVGDAATLVGDIKFSGTLGIKSKNYTYSNSISGPNFIKIAADATFNIPANRMFTLDATLSGAGNVINNGVINIINNGKIDDINIAGNGTIIVNPEVVMNIINDLNSPGQVFNNYGTLKIQGNRNINAVTYASPGVQVFTITNQNIYDSITSNGAINLSGGTVDIVSTFKSCHNQNYQWDVITGNTLLVDDATKINLPKSSYFHAWRSNVTDTTLTVEYAHTDFSSEAPEKYSDMAAALDYMLAQNNRHANQSLVQNLASCPCHSEYLAALDKLQPNLNVQSNYIAVQNATLNKVEMRVSGLRDVLPSMPGIAYGDINPNTAVWLAGFGSVANQKQTTSIAGYRATAAGGLLGFDRKCNNGMIYGVALGYSNSNIDGALNTDFNTRIIGYHGLAYGTKDINENNFYEWLATGITNSNVGSRQININNIDWSVTANYNTWQGGVRFNLGQYIDFDTWRFSQIETLRYTLLHQPSYNEVGSPAALHIETQEYSSILTVGLGYRMSWTGHDAWAVGSRELRALVTYDAITADNVTTANFIAGGSDFTISNSASRLALQLGADYAVTFYDKVQLQFSYDFELRNQYTDNSAEIRVRYLF